MDDSPTGCVPRFFGAEHGFKGCLFHFADRGSLRKGEAPERNPRPGVPERNRALRPAPVCQGRDGAKDRRVFCMGKMEIYPVFFREAGRYSRRN